MTAYGFRLYDVTLRRGRRQAPVPFQSAGPVPEQPAHFREHLVELLTDLKGRLLVGQPKVASAEGAGTELEDDSPVQDRLLGSTAFRIQDFRVSEGLVVGVVRRGRYGSHDVAMGPDETVADVPLAGFAPSDWYRFIFALPDEGTHALLAIEDLSRSCPVELLVKWLGQRSRELSEAALLTAETPATPDWWRLVARQVTDPSNLDRLLESGAFGTVTLTKHAFSADRTRRKTDYQVTAPQIQDGAIGPLRRIILGWRRDAGSDAPPVSDAEGARQLAALVARELESIEFDDGQISMPGSGARPLKPSRLTELFTYEQTPSDRRSAGVPFYRSIASVAGRLTPLGEADEPGLEWPTSVNLEFPEVTG